ncbi:SusC/RagA family TonB-linked outer membrane protein [Dyadobacter subterraneus]|uniref:SusC/RagA family TonB-linked outer membrane protein n=1 Tax=Dyadobacter subterraneus TaxID=2773304 RepID=A0ABR9W6J6_9BACT|nr:SusC/RagA family TonB-linked outer membrane protein [Dyadobacter subterraneus]MBE9461081.1 SusC/RagA family TonB-linked outer membrane protein [Dyadobacter subterraneus]
MKKKLLKNRSWVFILLGFFFTLSLANAQDKMVMGKVSDENGAGLPGVSITVKGSNAGTNTDVNGDYKISNVTPASVLVFSSIGYSRKEILVGDKTEISLKMDVDAANLEEVVVTALGISKDKKALAYAVTEVKGSDFTQAREINLGNALSGKIAGVNASSTATGPGGSSRVLIRGNGSLSGGNQPLYVINGVPIDNTNVGSAGMWGGFDTGDGLNSINPDDIESISVLKGGTAAALYGSRAGNGVILITTKTGKGSKGIGVEYSGTYTAEKVRNLTDWQYLFGSGTQGVAPGSKDEAIANGAVSWGSKLDPSKQVIQFDGVARPYEAQKKNIENFYRTGSTFSNTVAVSGGDEKMNFRFSASNADSKGVVPNASFNRKSFNLSVNANLARKLIFESVAQYNIEEGRNRSFLSDTPKNPNFAAYMLATNVDIRNLAPGVDSRGYETLWNGSTYSQNPYFATDYVKNSDDRKRFLGSFSLRYNLANWLYVRGRLGTDLNTIDFVSIEPTGIAYSTRGSMGQNARKISETNAELLLGVNKDFGDFSFNAILGGNKMYHVNQNMYIGGSNFVIPFNYFLGNLQSSDRNIEYKPYKINSTFVSADLSWRNILFLTFTGREDWFSTLAKANNHIFYPSVGLGYILSDGLKSKPNWLTYAKVRGSWAQVGGGYPDPYALNLTYSLQGNPYSSYPLMNIGTNTIPNQNLKPNTSTTTEFGLETKLFQSRINLDLTYYKRVTTNDPVKASTSSASAYSDVLLNVGEVRNQGIELLLSGTPFRSKNGLSWNVSFNMAYNDNKVVKIADGLPTLSLDESRTRNAYIYHFEGQPYGMIAGSRMKRNEAGQVIYNSATGIPVQGDFEMLARGVPPITMGLTNTISFKGISLGVLLDGKFGGYIYSATNAFAMSRGLLKETAENGVRETGVALKGVDQNGAEFSKTITAQDYYSGIATTITDQSIFKSDFVKLRQMTLGYSIPKSAFGKLPIQSASLSFVARNLFILYKKTPNVDPESSFNSGNAQGLEMFGVPPTRSYGLNLMVKF